MNIMRIFYSLFISCFALTLIAQSPWRSHLSFEYGIQVPIFDMADRFGHNFKLSSEFDFLNAKSGWVAGVDGAYLFGINVREDVLLPLRTMDGEIIGNNRAPASVALRERGFYAGMHAGRIFPFKKEMPLSGIKLRLGAGFLQHKIRIQDNTQSVTQLTGDYKKGYDRLSNGAALSFFAGYQHYDDLQNIHLIAGFDFHLAFTQNRRSYNFDTMQADDTDRTDGLFGFKIGWILPIGKGDSEKEIFY